MPYCKNCDHSGSSADFGGRTGSGYRCPKCGSYNVDY